MRFPAAETPSGVEAFGSLFETQLSLRRDRSQRNH